MYYYIFKREYLYEKKKNNILNHYNYFYLLTDTELSVYSNNGKKSFSDTHGLSSPVLCESDARCLIYDQNGTGVRIYNAKKLILTKDNKNEIYACDIIWF